MDAGRYRLGIDIGTSNTVAAIADQATGRTLPLLFDSSPLLPSAVFAGPDGTLLVGLDAERAAAGNPAGLERNPKRRIDEGTVWLADRAVAVADLIAALLRRVAGEAGRVTGRSPDEVVLTHPATWGPVRMGVLADAAARAGMGRVRFTAEPVAAAAYFAGTAAPRLAPGRALVVYDLGAGTFDATVLRADPGGFATLASGGLDDVGGLDLDAAVVGHARALTGPAAEPLWQRLDWPQTPADQRARQQLWAGAKAAKEQLSRHPAADVHVPLVETTVRLTREEFDRLALPYLERTAAQTLIVVHQAGVTPEQVGGVFLVGGSSRLPLAATVLHRTLRIAPIVLDHPELVVAEGAAFTAPSAPAPTAFRAPSAAAPTAFTAPRAPAPAAVPPQRPPMAAPVPVSPPIPAAPTPAAPMPAAPMPAAPAAAPMPTAPPTATVRPAPAAVPGPAPAPAVTPVRPPTLPAAEPADAAPVAPSRDRGKVVAAVAGGVVIALIVAVVVGVIKLIGGGGDDGSGDDALPFDSWSPTGTGTVLFRDDFTARHLGAAWHPKTGSWTEVGDGLLSGNGDVAGWPTVALETSAPADLVVHFRAKLDKAGSVELMLHTDGTRYVRAFLSAKDGKAGIGDGKLNTRGGADGGPETTSSARTVTPGSWYDVVVTVKSRTYTITVNGTKAVDYTDSKGALSAKGTVGFAASDTPVVLADVVVVSD